MICDDTLSAPFWKNLSVHVYWPEESTLCLMPEALIIPCASESAD